MPAYDSNNIFAKILRGEFPCHKVYEDDHVLAFLDIMPRSPGHTLVIPKAPARNILDITPEDYAHVARGAHKIAAAAMIAFKADGITVQQFNEGAVIPGRFEDANLRCAIAHRGISKFRVRCFASPRYDAMGASLLRLEVPGLRRRQRGEFAAVGLD